MLVSGCYGGKDEGWFDPCALLQAFKRQVMSIYSDISKYNDF